MSVTQRLGEFIAIGCDIDDPVLQGRAVDAVVDTIGCIHAGLQTDTLTKLQRALKPPFGTNGTPHASFGETSAGDLALILGTAAHVWDLDDWEDRGNTHPSAVLVPALIAASKGRAVSGTRFLRAYATGFEVIARVGSVAGTGHYQSGFHVTGTIGAFGAAAAVANLMTLDREGCAHAVALAASQAMGLTAQFGSDAKALQAGLAAKAGLLAASMAGAGMTAAPDVLEGCKGFFSATNPDWNGDLSTLDALGDPPALTQPCLFQKAYPSCAYTHRLIACAEEISRKPEYSVARVQRIEAHLPDFHRAILPYSKPDSLKQALMSLEFSIAEVLLGRSVSVASLHSKPWEASESRHLASKIDVVTSPAVRPDLPIDPAQPDRLSVRCNGHLFEAQCDWPRGAPHRPLSRADFIAKHAGFDLSRLFDWADSDDVAMFVERALAGQPAATSTSIKARPLSA